MEHVGILIPIFTVIGVVVMIIFLRKYSNMERMAMIEKGVSDELFKTQADTALWPLRFALLLIGAGLGLLFGYLLDHAFNMKDVAYFSMILIFGGLGLSCAYIIEERKNKNRS